MDSYDFNPARRRFLTGMLAVGAASALGPNPLIKKVWAAGENPQQWIQSGSHFGAFEARVENGEWVETRPFKHDKYPCDMLNAVREVVYNPSRVRYPMVRLDWLRKREKSDRSQRGNNRFVRVSWDQALDLFYEELERVQKTYGSSGVFTGLADWQMVGKYHKAGGAMDRGLGLHGSYVTTVGDYSAAAAQVILPRVIGALEVYEQQTSLPLVIEHTDTIVLWGCDPIKNLQIEFLVPDHDAFGYWQQIKEAIAQGKMRVISVDPVRSKSQNFLNCEQLALRPQTDVALLLGVAHTLYDEKRYDVGFINDYTVGFEQFIPYLTGETDKQPKNAEWAAEICGLTADQIRQFARQLVKGRTQFMGDGARSVCTTANNIPGCWWCLPAWWGKLVCRGEAWALAGTTTAVGRSHLPVLYCRGLAASTIRQRRNIRPISAAPRSIYLPHVLLTACWTQGKPSPLTAKRSHIRTLKWRFTAPPILSMRNRIVTG